MKAINLRRVVPNTMLCGLFVLSGAVACSEASESDGGTGGDPGEDDDSTTSTTTTASGGSGSSSGGSGSGGSSFGTGGDSFSSSGGTGSVERLDCTSQTDLTPPFAVNTTGEFFSTGFMGDHVDISAADCTDRAPGAIGECQGFTYSGETGGWAGVVWQYPDNNWGEQPGKCIGDGATTVTFYAKAETEGVALTFGATDVEGTEIADQELGTEWTQYEIPLTDYNASALGGTISGFLWVGAAATGAGTFYIDSIQWETDAGGLGGASGM